MNVRGFRVRSLCWWALQTVKEQRKLPKRFQIGTIVESVFEGRAGRLTNAERQNSIAAELAADESFKCVPPYTFAPH